MVYIRMFQTVETVVCVVVLYLPCLYFYFSYIVGCESLLCCVELHPVAEILWLGYH